MMKCGHAANATKDDKPCCVICYGLTPGAGEIDSSPPNLGGRQARCPSCGRTQPSSPNLAFYEYRGAGSEYARQCKNCGIFEIGHTRKQAGLESTACDNYEPNTQGKEYDLYYCGCQGWG